MIRIDKKVLTEGLKDVVRIVPRNTTMSILEGILIECKNNNMSITATDLSMAITTNLACETEMIEENYVINAKLFNDIINKMPSGDIEITILEEGKKIEIKGGKSKFKIATLGKSTDYPSFKAEIENEVTISIAGDKFKEVVRRTVPFTAEDETRPILTGIRLEFNKNTLKGISLDGYRLSHYVENIENEIEKEVVIQSDVLVHVSRITGEDIKISFDKDEVKNVKFETGNKVIYARILEGQFLNYKDLIKINNVKTNVKIDTEEFKKAIERVLVVVQSNNRNTPTILEFNSENNKLTITTKTDIATTKEELDVEIQGESVTIAFNPKFLYEGLKVVEDEKVEMRLSGSLKQGYILDEKDYIYLILPMRIAELEKAS